MRDAEIKPYVDLFVAIMNRAYKDAAGTLPGVPKAERGVVQGDAEDFINYMRKAYGEQMNGFRYYGEPKRETPDAPGSWLTIHDPATGETKRVYTGATTYAPGTVPDGFRGYGQPDRATVAANAEKAPDGFRFYYPRGDVKTNADNRPKAPDGFRYYNAPEGSQNATQAPQLPEGFRAYSSTPGTVNGVTRASGRVPQGFRAWGASDVAGETGDADPKGSGDLDLDAVKSAFEELRSQLPKGSGTCPKVQGTKRKGSGEFKIDPASGVTRRKLTASERAAFQREIDFQKRRR